MLHLQGSAGLRGDGAEEIMLNRLLSRVALTLSALYAQDEVIDLNGWKPG